MNFTEKFTKRVKEDEKFIFYVISILFTIIFLFVKMAGDDIGGMHLEGGSVKDYWEKSLNMYSMWTSRIFVNFLCFFFRIIVSYGGPFRWDFLYIL